MKRQSESNEQSSTKKSNAHVHKHKYMTGFGGEHATEAVEGALPVGQNTPQKCAFGLYAEQLSGTSFTTPRVHNQRSWLYRVRPTVVHKPFHACTGADANPYLINDFSNQIINPSQLRWKPAPMPKDGETRDFIRGLATVGGSGSPDVKTGFAIHLYTCNKSMDNTGFCNSDGDFLIVPQEGEITIRTEMGYLEVPPGHIAVVQRGITFQVMIDKPSRGYVCEVYNGHFRLPDLGPIGANGLANPRDFLYPVASYENVETEYTIVQKFCGKLFSYQRVGGPFDVVAWHGNYAPYKYDLAHFCVVNSVSFDHLDPSIFTVLTCPTAEPGVACVDFVIFPPRFAVQEHTFRPPYYHRNCMSEYMGNIMGKYEAKPDGFMPGAGSLHSCMIGHGPDAATYDKATKAELKPVYMPADSLSFMFESTYMMKVTDWAMNVCPVDHDYYKCWQALPNEFNPDQK